LHFDTLAIREKDTPTNCAFYGPFRNLQRCAVSFYMSTRLFKTLFFLCQVPYQYYYGS
jgi:hypothetical protein